ncbi:MAG: hypothetical protein JWQ99_3076 [Blastococcus sp.]|jgi:hypothetical protein|nr:hypothetical protein [Blastococcus sp.]
MAVERQVLLRFAAAGPAPDTVSDLSAVCRDGDVLWVAGDELPVLYRLTAARDGSSYADARSYRLGEFVGLPDGPDDEVDVEGLDRGADCLWLIGSHSRTRKRVDPGDDDAKVAKVLATVRTHPNRNVLVRVPLADDGGLPAPSAGSSAALLDGDLLAALASDEHLGPFLAIPGKDNGLDVEGLVAVDGGLLLGLRGPVLRGWAVVLEIDPRSDSAGKLRLGGPGPGYRKFFLDLDGLGVRDLCRDGDDVLVLAGPTMDLDGPVRLHRWTGAARVRDRTVAWPDDLERLADLPYGRGEDEGTDHAEGLTLLPDGRTVLVVYDSPSPARQTHSGGVLADVIGLPATAAISAPPFRPAARGLVLTPDRGVL